MVSPEDKNQYYLNRNDLIEKLKSRQEEIENITLKGIRSEGDEILARAVCSFFLSEMLFEEGYFKEPEDDGFSF